MFSEETDWLYRFRAAGWKVCSSPAPRSCTSAARRTAGRMSRREPARHLRFVAQAPRRAGGGARAARCSRARCALRGARVPRRARAQLPRGRARGLGVRRRARELLDRERARGGSTLATVVVLAPGRARRARARGAASSRASRGALAACSSRRVTFVDPRLARARARCSPRGVAALPFALRRGARRARPRSGSAVLRRRRRSSGSCSGACAGDRRGDALFHLARVRKLVSSTTSRCDAVDEFVDGGLHPGYAFPLWHGFLALVAKVAGVDPTEVVRARGGGARAARVPRRVRGGRGGVPLALARRRGARRHARADRASRPAHGGAYASLALPGDGGAAAARARRRSRSSSVPAAPDRAGGSSRSPRPGSCSRSSTRRTRSSRCSPLGGYALVRLLVAPEELARALALAAVALAARRARLSPGCCRLVQDTASSTRRAAGAVEQHGFDQLLRASSSCSSPTAAST